MTYNQILDNTELGATHTEELQIEQVYEYEITYTHVTHWNGTKRGLVLRYFAATEKQAFDAIEAMPGHYVTKINLVPTANNEYEITYIGSMKKEVTDTFVTDTLVNAVNYYANIGFEVVAAKLLK